MVRIYYGLIKELGYKLDIYHLETIPSVYDNMQKPMSYMEHKDGTIEKIGETDMRVMVN